MERYIIPKRIVISENTDNADILLKESERQAYLKNSRSAALIKDGGYVIVDFGYEIQGGANITIQNVSKENETFIRFVFGESVGEAMSSIGFKNACNDHSPRDFKINAVNWSNMTVGNTGFRFLKIQACEGDVKVANLSAVLKCRDIEYIGSFECDDEMLNKIWNVGAYTVHLNMQEYLWDGIKRDRLVWVGDMHPEVMTVLSVFGNNNVVTKSLDLVKSLVSEKQWMIFESYTMSWILIQYDWYMYTGDFEYLKKQTDYLYPILENIIDYIGESGDVKFENNFIDWSTADDEKMKKGGIQALTVITLKIGAKLCEYLGNKKLAKKCKKAAQTAQKCNVDYSENKQVAARAILAQMCDFEKAREFIKKDGAKGLSVFWGYYVLCAMAETDDVDGEEKLMKEYWGKMIECGATTFWEEFDLEWLKDNPIHIDEIPCEGRKELHGDFGAHCFEGYRLSLCHGWSSGPVPFISKYIMGVNPIKPGMREIELNPKLGFLKTVKGAVPTPYGALKFRHTKTSDGIVKTEILECPKEIIVKII